ncbi:MAG TPA: hypothetical protein VGQ09_13940 [Chitinophagaceae bacterium]|jgi:hypothetical protein|nr:hypothetical protein [Chitinophagaceae bacterium]
MARGDKNKQGNSGRRSSKQSDQPFTGAKHKKSDHNRRHTEGEPSEPQESRTSFDDGNRSSQPEYEARPLRTEERSFNLIVDNVPYVVKATPFLFNGETRYKVSFNGSSEHVFTWDSSLGQLRAIDDDSSTLPVNLEEAISEKLQYKA